MSGPSQGLPLVVVVVGTDHHPFDRLVAWADAWAREHPEVRTVIQYGTSAPPVAAAGTSLVSRDELQDLFVRADVIVSHGGPSTIVEASRLGRVPVVVPRSPELGEHVDGHQQRFSALMAARGLIRVATSGAELAELLDEDLRTGPPQPTVPLDDPAAGAARVAEIVATLVARPARRSRWWRRPRD